jgi:hypothetical protein
VCTLRRHDARDDGGVEYRALLRAVAAFAKGERHGAWQADVRLGDGNPLRHFLRAYIDHRWSVAAIEMREA